MSEIKAILREATLNDFLAVFVGFPVIGFLFILPLVAVWMVR